MSASPGHDGSLTLADLHLCFEGAVPAVIATADAAGVPNITYLSRVRVVDDHHVALSNQFFSKTTKNLVERPYASVLVIDPTTYDQYRIDVAYTRTERGGPVFDALSADVDLAATEHGMEGVFRLRAADIYRVVAIEPVLVHATPPPRPDIDSSDRPDAASALALLGERLGRCNDLDAVVSTTMDLLAGPLGYDTCSLLLTDETGATLYTIASRGYPDEGVGSEVRVGDGVIGVAAARMRPVRVGNLGQMTKYGRTVRQGFESTGEVGPGREIPLPASGDVESRLAAPGAVLGALVAVVVVERRAIVAFDAEDEAVVSAVASLVAQAIVAARSVGDDAEPPTRTAGRPIAPAPPDRDAVRVRYYALDGSTFLDGDYLIKGVAGRILWSLLREHQRDGRVEFTNKEVRLDPTLELPEYRDNLESRLILLRRRLVERDAPLRLVATGRGRFRLEVDRPIALEVVEASDEA